MATQPQLTEKLTNAQFAQRIRQRHPGAYDDLSDDDLTNKVISKYPEYKDMLAPQMTAAQQAPILDKMQREQSGGEFTGALREAALVPFKALGFTESQTPVADLLSTTVGEPAKFWGQTLLSPLQSLRNVPAATKEVFNAIGEPLAKEREKGKAALERGQIIEPLIRAATGSVPVLGPMVGEGLEKFAQGRVEGSLPEMVRGAGEVVAPLAPFSPRLRAAAATGVSKAASGAKAVGRAIGRAPLAAARPLIQRISGTNLEALQRTARLPQEVQETVQASLAAEKAKMRAYAKSQYEPVDAAVGPIALEPQVIEAVAQHLPAKTVGDILEGGSLSRPSFSQVQELKSALHRVGERATEPVQRNFIFNLRDNLNAKLSDSANRAGVLPEFQNAQKTFAQYAQDWLESPLADALEATNPTDVLRAFTDKSGAQAARLAHKYGVDTVSLDDFLSLGQEKGAQILKDSARLEQLGPKKFADMRLREIGEERSRLTPWDFGAMVAPPLLMGPMGIPTAAGILAARHSPALGRIGAVRRVLTANLPDEFARPAPEPYSSTLQGEFVPPPGTPPAPQLPAMGGTSTPMNRGTGIPPVAPTTPEGRGLLLRSNPQAITNAARDFAMNAPEGQLALPAPTGGPSIPPQGTRPFSLLTPREVAGTQGRLPDFKDTRAIAVGESTIPQLPASSRRVLTTPMGEEGATQAVPAPNRLLPAGPEILSESVTRIEPSPRRPLPAPAVTQGGQPASLHFASKERAEVAAAPSATPQQMKQTLATETAELKRRLLTRPDAPDAEKVATRSRIKENEEMMTKFETKEGKQGVVDKEGKFTMRVKEPEGGWKGRTVSWTDKGTRYEIVVDEVITDKQGRVLLKGYDDGMRHVEAGKVKVKK